jgi:hypothetical protein
MDLERTRWDGVYWAPLNQGLENVVMDLRGPHIMANLWAR